MNMVVEKKSKVENWEELWEMHNGSMFLSSVWLETLREKNKIPVYILFKQEEKIIAVAAGLERPVGEGPEKQLFFYAGIASNSNQTDILNACKKNLLVFCQQNGFSRIIFKSYDYYDIEKNTVKEFKPFKRKEFVIDLAPEKEQIINRIDRDTRRRVRKAKREGAEFKAGYSEELLEALEKLMGSTFSIRSSKGYGSYQKFTMPFLDEESIKKLLQKRAACFYYIEYQGRIVSIQFAVELACRTYGVYMGTSEQGYKLAAPSALFYETTLLFKRKGYTSYNIGAVPLGKANQGIRKFKKDLGATIIESREESTDFLLKPLSKLNILLRLKRRVNKILIPWKIKKVLLQIIDQIIGGRDKY